MNPTPLTFIAGALSALAGAAVFRHPPHQVHDHVAAHVAAVPVPEEVPYVGEVLLRDGFDRENRGRPTLMYDRFEQWDVVGGTVDLVGRGSDWDFQPGNGLYVDLDGDRPNGVDFDAGALVSRRTFRLEPGTYELRFRLAGSQRGDFNVVGVGLGPFYAEQVTLPSAAPFREYVRNIHVHEAGDANVSFENAGADGYGLLLDDVVLRRLD